MATTANRPVQGRSTAQQQEAASASDLEHLQNNRIEGLSSSNDAKDKTQVASTTSMAVIHIGILKVLLDAGPDTISYYNWCLGLVIAAVGLQFISGVLAIYIAMIKSFLSQFHGDFSYYCKSSFCPCLKDSKKDVPMVASRSMAVTIKMRGDTEGSGERQNLIEHDDTSHTGCCTCCTQKTPSESPNYEEMVLDEYNNWMKRNFDMQKEAVRLKQQVCSKESKISKLASQQQLRASKPPDSTDSGNMPSESTEQELLDEEYNLECLRERQLECASFQKEGIILRNQLKNLMDDKVMKKAAFWQCVLTSLTYMVFALNAFITGFGLANISDKYSENSTG